MSEYEILFLVAMFLIGSVGVVAYEAGRSIGRQEGYAQGKRNTLMRRTVIHQRRV